MRLEKTHPEDIKVYDPNGEIFKLFGRDYMLGEKNLGGRDNLKRLTGRHETSSAESFSWGISDRTCSVRITRGVAEAGKVGFSRKLKKNVEKEQSYAEIRSFTKLINTAIAEMTLKN